MTTTMTKKAAPGVDSQGIIPALMPLRTNAQLIKPKELSKSHHQMMAAMTEGTAQGSATRTRAALRPAKR